MMLGATTQHYNRLGAALLSKLQLPSLAEADQSIISELRAFSSKTDVWPVDEEIRRRLEDEPLYYYINARRIRVLLEACEHALAANTKTEQIPIPDKLTVEHALPQEWSVNWRPEAPAR